MKRLAMCALAGCVLAVPCCLAATFIVGNIYAEELSLLVPTQVHQVALKTADWVQGYDYEP